MSCLAGKIKYPKIRLKIFFEITKLNPFLDRIFGKMVQNRTFEGQLRPCLPVLFVMQLVLNMIDICTV